MEPIACPALKTLLPLMGLEGSGVVELLAISFIRSWRVSAPPASRVYEIPSMTTMPELTEIAWPEHVIWAPGGRVKVPSETPQFEESRE